MRRADEARLEAIAALFARFGSSPTVALVRARTLYFMQIGYYAAEVRETLANRLALLGDYALAFCGEVPRAEDLEAFTRRNPA